MAVAKWRRREEEGGQLILCSSSTTLWMTAAHYTLVLCVATYSAQCVVLWDVAKKIMYVDTVQCTVEGGTEGGGWGVMRP